MRKWVQKNVLAGIAKQWDELLMNEMNFCHGELFRHFLLEDCAVTSISMQGL